MSTLRVEVRGDGPDLVLLHGWAMHGGIFAGFVEWLAARWRVRVVDLPGHGGSRDCGIPLALDPCVQAIRAVVPAQAAWCGWSLGGLVALHAAATCPDDVRALAMLCATPCFVRREDWRFGVSADIFHDFAHGLRSDWRGTLDRFMALEAFGSDHARDELRALREAVLARGEPDAHVLAAGLELLEQADLRGVLPSLRMPTAWIAGRRDRLVDPRAMRLAAEEVPGAVLTVVEHAGHAPFLTHGDAVAAALEPLR